MKGLSLLLLISIACSAIPSLYAQTSIWDGSYTEQQADRGQETYTANCESCHGSDLGGNSNSPGLSGMSFMFIWEGRSLAELYTSMRNNMPSNRPASLSKQSYEDLLAFLLRANNFPSGSQRLDANSPTLEELKISPQP